MPKTKNDSKLRWSDTSRLKSALAFAQHFRYVLLTSLIIAFTLYANRALLHLGMLSFGDMVPFPVRFDPPLFLSGYSPSHLGSLFTPSVGALSKYLFALFINNGVLGQKIFLLSWMPLSFATMFLFLKRFSSSMTVRMVGAFLYVVNPVTITDINGGGDDGLFAFALLPLVLIYMHRILGSEKKIVFNTLMLSALLAVASFFYRDIMIVIMPVFLIFIFTSVLRERKIRKTLILFCSFFASLGLLLILNLPYYGYSISYFAQYLGSFSPDHGLTFVQTTYQYMVPLNILRMLGGHLEWYPDIYGMNPFSAFGFVLTIFAFLALVIRSKPETRKYSVDYALIFVVVILFGYSTHLGITIFLFERLPLFYVLRESGKLLYIIRFVLPVLMVLSLSALHENMTKTANSRFPNIKKRTRKIAFALLILLVLFVNLIFNNVFLSGDMGTQQVLNTRFPDDSTSRTIEVPSTYLNLANWISARRTSEGFFRTLWLPYDRQAQLVLASYDPYAINLVEVSVYPGDYFSFFIARVLTDGLSDRVASLLAYASVKYVIVTKCSNTTGPPRLVYNHLIGAPEEFLNLLGTQVGLERIVDTKDYAIYLNKEQVEPVKIYDSLMLVKANNEPEKLQILSENLVSNPSFENGLANWYIDPGVTADNETVYNGQMSLKMIRNSSSTWSNAIQDIPIGEGVTLRVSFYMKTSNAKQSHVKILWSNGTNYFKTDFVQLGTDGDNDWFFLNQTIESPINAKTMSLMFVGGSSLNEISPGVTWIDDILVELIFEQPPLIDPNYSAIISLCYVPWINMSDTLPVFFDANQLDSKILGESATLALWGFDQSSIQNLYSLSPSLLTQLNPLMIYEAERHFKITVLTANSSLSIYKTPSASNGYNLNITGYVQLTEKIEVLMDGLYLVGLRGINSSMVKLDVDGEPAVLGDSTNLKSGLYSWLTAQVNLTKGVHDINLLVKGPKACLDMLVVQKVDQNGKDEFTTTPLIENLVSGATSHTFSAVSGNRAFLFLSQSFDPNWKGTIDGKQLNHFQPIGWANGFAIDEPLVGNEIIDIKLDNSSYQMFILVWILIWIITFSVLVFLSVNNKTQKLFRKLSIHKGNSTQDVAQKCGS